jgi:4-amino-4-deoxy-L-arabinose transferase-like glycosyltransferase
VGPAGSLLAWVVLWAAVPPAAQNFPLNDDWAFARGAMLFAQGKCIHYGGWASMPQLGQWLWACPFLWLLGESFFALRVATIVLSWVGLWAFYDLLRQQGHSPGTAALAATVLAVNPLFFLLSGTFMTDVPALSLSLIALALYGRGLRPGGTAYLATACVVAVLAVITRQNTLPVVVVAAYLLWCRPELRRRVAGWVAVLMPAAAGLAVHFWFQARPDVRALSPALPAGDALLALPFQAVHFCGLCALPLLLVKPPPRPLLAFAVATGLLLACAAYWGTYGANSLPYEGGLFPYTENMLTPWGAFAGSRHTQQFLPPGQRPLILGPATRALLTVLGCVGGAGLLTRALQGWRGDGPGRPLELFALLQVPFLLMTPDLYDRYFLFLLPGAFALALPAAAVQPRPGSYRLLGGVAVTVALGVVSVALMHDWLAWNSARWELGRRAVARGTDPLDIEGGVEWDGWSTLTRPAAPPGRRWTVLPFTAEWFDRVRGRYWLSFSPALKGLPADPVDQQPYSLWLSPGPRRFYLLRVAPVGDGPAATGR